MTDPEIALIEREKKLSKYAGADRIVSNLELYDQMHADRKLEPPVLLKSKIPTLDAHIKGFYGGEVTVISGPTGMGKTLFAQTLTDSFCKQEKKSLWFTYEVGAYDFLDYFGFPLPPFVMPRELKESSLDWIEERMLEAKLKFGIEAVFIDHLHYLIDLERNYNTSLEAGRVLRFLKKFAVAENVHIFLLAHMRKVKLEDEPGLGDTRDSSMIDQEAANVFYLWRLANTETESKLKIAKNRRFGVSNKYVHLHKVGKFLWEVDSVTEVAEIGGRDTGDECTNQPIRYRERKDIDS